VYIFFRGERRGFFVKRFLPKYELPIESIFGVVIYYRARVYVYILIISVVGVDLFVVERFLPQYELPIESIFEMVTYYRVYVYVYIIIIFVASVKCSLCVNNCC
jgi:hypothetical protein